MKKILGLTMGIMTSMGGFIDISNLVFATQAGAQFQFHLLWPLWIGAFIITVYAEMSGRVAIVAKKAAFDVIEEKLGYTLGLCTLIASNINNLMVCAAEIGGVAFILRLLLNMPYSAATVVALFLMLIVIALLPFKIIEKVFGLGGLLMLIFLFATVRMHPDWASVAQNLIPNVPPITGHQLIVYAYFAIGLVATGIIPYEVYLYSSGQIEEKKTEKDLSENTLTAVIGFGFGTLLSFSLIILAAMLFLPQKINPQLVGSAPQLILPVYGKIGLLVALLGMLFAMGGATVETCLAGAYNVAQFFKWPWGKQKKLTEVPRFTVAWILMLVLALIVLATGIDPVKLTNYAVIFSVIVMPFTYLPILLISNDESIMGKHKNKQIVNILAWFCFVLIIVVSLSAIPLLIMTNGGQS
jgi:manganese transport protein